MAGYTLVYTKTAVKSIDKLSPAVRKRLGVKLEFFMSQPNPLAFAKALTKPADAQYRWRIGDYRVLFDVKDQKVIILLVQHRRQVYER